MTDRPNTPAVRLEDARERVIQLLSEHFAQDHLSLEELETRMTRVYAASNQEELSAILAGLPSLGQDAASAPLAEGQTAIATGVREESKTLFALMGGVVRRGVWAVPQKIHAIAIMGGVEIDLREAPLPPGVTEVSVFTLMGGVEVRVPPHVRLETDGFAIMGGFEDTVHQPPSLPSAPVVRVTGVAIMGGVEARVEPPDNVPPAALGGQGRDDTAALPPDQGKRDRP